MRRIYNEPILQVVLSKDQENEAPNPTTDMKNRFTTDEKEEILQAASKGDGEGVLDAVFPNRDKTRRPPTVNEVKNWNFNYVPNEANIFHFGNILNANERVSATLKAWNEYLPDIYTLHCTFVHDQYNDDYTVAFLNEPLTIPRKYEQYQNQQTFKLWVTDSTDDSTEPYANRVDLLHPVRSFLKTGVFNNTKDEILDTLKQLYQYVLIIQLELEF